MTTYNPTTWAQALLAKIGAPADDQNTQAVVAWETAEGGHWHNTATYNPLNTTQSEPGAYPINSAGVEAYTSWDQGLTATTATLQNGAYAPILSALATGTDPQSVLDAIVASPWGTTSISLGSGSPTTAAGSPGATDASLTSAVTGSVSNLVFTALFILGGVALLVAGIGKATGTRPVHAAAKAANPL